MFYESYTIVKSDTKEFYVRIVRKEVAVKSRLHPESIFGPGENYDLGFSLDLVLFSIWHTTLPVCQDPIANIPMLNQYFY